MTGSRTSCRLAPLLCVAAILCAIAAANSVYLAQVHTNDPMLYHSGLGSPVQGWLTGGYSIDGNDGWTAQALGRRAALSWSNGHLPLWNPYEGFGQPLAGEMQSAAFFLPFILLQLLPNGVFAMHLALEVVAGLSTLMFLRSLRLGWVAATVGGCLFALNGTFAVMTNAPFNPIAFLPLALWGVEMVVDRVRRGRAAASGVGVIALAIAWMLYSGFPETALLEALFVASWVLVRLIEVPRHRRAVILSTTTGALCGLLLSAPLLLLFKEFLDFGTTAYHEGIANDVSYPARQIASLAMPFGTGGMYNAVLRLQAGYLTAPAVLLAVIGLLGPRRRPTQVLLGGVFVVLVANMFGFRPVKLVLNHVPGVSSVLVYKYGLVLIEFVVVMLAAWGLDDIVRRRTHRAAVLTAFAAVVLYLGGAFLFVHREGLVTSTRWTSGVFAATLLACLALSALGLSGRAGSSGTRCSLLAALILVIDAAVTFAVPSFGASPPRPVDMQPVAFLQRSLGTSRFYTLGPIQPNYGSYWGIAQLNANDLPIAKKYSDFLVNDLAPDAGTPAARGTHASFNAYQLVPFNPPVAEQRTLLLAYEQKREAFREAGAEYLVASPGVVSDDDARRLGLTRVHRSLRAEIWHDAAAKPYYTVDGASCRIGRQTLTSVRLTCDAPGTLTRRALSSPGWTVNVNGHETEVKDAAGQRFQQVRVPAGESTITFHHRPACLRAAIGLSLMTLFALGLGAATAWRRNRRGGEGPGQGGVNSVVTPVPHREGA